METQNRKKTTLEKTILLLVQNQFKNSKDVSYYEIKNEKWEGARR
jgi:hypothetical protein